MSTSSDPLRARALLREVEDGIAREAGGYLRNTLREAGVTCEVCLRPLEAGADLTCGPCASACHAWQSRLSDRVGFITYAGINEQSRRLMYGYKWPAPAPEHPRMIKALLVVALKAHAKCPGILAGVPVRRWCTVPSLRRRSGQHPLNAIVGGIASGGELTLEADPAFDTVYARDVDADHFTVTASDSCAGQHVLIIDDTWTRGGHAQSAAITLKDAGAAHVSTLVVARWLREDYPATAALWRSRIAHGVYQAAICPWTNGPCP